MTQVPREKQKRVRRYRALELKVESLERKVERCLLELEKLKTPTALTKSTKRQPGTEKDVVVQEEKP